MFQPVDPRIPLPEHEEAVLRFWEERGIYEKSLAQRAGGPKFVFYEGPPTANGLPHPGHCLTRAMKDLFPRYRTMRGYRCERKAGWDTHGLPVEVEVCKELGIHSKAEIEAYGVERFIHRCLESVFRYTRQWEQMTRRIGFWIHLDEAYVTYHQSYVESVWWALKTLFDRGLLYQRHKIVWWWAQGGTALSSGEVGQGYREVDDPSVYVRFPLLDESGQMSDIDLLVWTTTPWTLPSNQFAAVHPGLEYACVRDDVLGRKLIVAAGLVEVLSRKFKRPLTVESTCRGETLVGRRYVPPFDYYYRTQGQRQGALRDGGQQHVAWRVCAADFVTTESGTGLVHIAPAFGEVDYDLLMAQQERFVPGQGPELICAVAPDGTFTEEAGAYAGRWVKEADRDILRELKGRGLLYHQETYRHDYPFCWRAPDDPLIQYPRTSWFIRTTALKAQMLANNARIGWLPEHIRQGRFGKFLESNVDWALSRERYWGTPLPIWVCEATGQFEAVASYAELLRKPGVRGTEAWDEARRRNPELPEHLRVHKPYIDAVTYDSPFAPGARMRRVSEVIDCWFDSGAMPFAQWGWPHQGHERFADQFPADFISEALDQTRGWFYSLLAISTLLFSEEARELSSAGSSRRGDATGAPPQPPSGGRKPQTQAAPPEVPEPVASSAPRVGEAPEPTATSEPPSDHSQVPVFPYPHPYRNCIVLGLMLAEAVICPKCERRFTGDVDRCEQCGGPTTRKVEKMSKSLRNYPEPQEVFHRYGADAMRWFFLANQPPWTSIAYSERAIKESYADFFITLVNVLNFLVTYAHIDGFDPAAQLAGDVGQLTPADLSRAATYRPAAQRSELDRWILSELHRTTEGMIQRLDAYDNFGAASLLRDFVDALSNWYVRRSRERFWAAGMSADKSDAYWTLYECLLTAARLMAPYVPFVAEWMWGVLVRTPFGARAAESVHLCDYPEPQRSAVDELLSDRMRLVREIASLGRSARSSAGLKVRQPLSLVEVVLADKTHQPWLEEHAELICDELNVKRLAFAARAEEYVTYTVLPNLPRLGPRLGKRLPAVRAALSSADPAKLLADLEARGQVVLPLPDGEVALDHDDIKVQLQAKQGWTAAQARSCVVVLNTELTRDLIDEGLALDVVRIVQQRRKDLGCAYTDRIRLGVVTTGEELKLAIARFADYIRNETLAVELVFHALAAEPHTATVGGHPLQVYVEVAKSK
jgi:isoleucyl-tRNA synthetase